MASKPIVLMAFPLALYVTASVIFNNAQVWQQVCGRDFTCQTPFQPFSMSGPLMLVLSGRLDLFWSSLTSPGLLITSTLHCATWNYWPSYTWCYNPDVMGAAVDWLLGIFAGVILVFISLGIHIHVEGASVAVELGSSGGQPAKLAQSLGIGLVIWSATYGLFGGWEGGLNKAVNGAGGIFDLIMTLTFIMGVLWFTQSRF